MGEQWSADRCSRSTGAGPCTLSTGVLSACGTTPGPGGTVVYHCAPVGDPAMTIVPPVEAYGTEHVFVVPSGYAVDFVSVLAPATARLLLDGEPLQAPARIGTDGEGVLWGRLTLPVRDGPHRLSSSLTGAYLRR